jgi:hypothetical protein
MPIRVSNSDLRVGGQNVERNEKGLHVSKYLLQSGDLMSRQ